MDPLQEYELELQVEEKANQMVCNLLNKYAGEVRNTVCSVPKNINRFGDTNDKNDFEEVIEIFRNTSCPTSVFESILKIEKILGNQDELNILVLAHIIQIEIEYREKIFEKTKSEFYKQIILELCYKDKKSFNKYQNFIHNLSKRPTFSIIITHFIGLQSLLSKGNKEVKRWFCDNFNEKYELYFTNEEIGRVLYDLCRVRNSIVHQALHISSKKYSEYCKKIYGEKYFYKWIKSRSNKGIFSGYLECLKENESIKNDEIW